MIAQADGAAAAAGQRPASAAAALRTIGDTGRKALEQMRRLLGVLREDARAPQTDAAFAPQPGTGQLGALVDQVARVGVPAHLSVDGAQRALPATVDVTVYRVAQEALTNVLKHAGTVTRVDVVLRYGRDAVELVVSDDGRGPAAVNGRGHGLFGMRERVDLHDGTLTVGARESGGFAVRAAIPIGRVAE
ncbi:MAG TPA: ATP-binding protein [Solirubrobacter sp.]|nr:ATP-binding protein [Solirubrobacter sp.]